MDEERSREKPPDVDPVLVDTGLPERVQRALRPTQHFDAKTAMAELNYRGEMLRKLRPMAFEELRAVDFVIQGDGDDAPCYLQDIGCQRVKPLLGLIYPEPPQVERRTLDDGGYAYIYSGFVISRTIGTADFVVGGRSSTDGFFDQKDRDGVEIPVDELDVQKAAYTNFECRAVSGLLGLRGLTVSELKAMGFKAIERARRVSYQKGAKGGGGATVVPRFGKTYEEFWGKPWSALPDMKALKFYADNATKTLANKEKAQFHSLAQRQLDSIRTEVHRRRDDKAAAEEAKG